MHATPPNARRRKVGSILPARNAQNTDVHFLQFSILVCGRSAAFSNTPTIRYHPLEDCLALTVRVTADQSRLHMGLETGVLFISRAGRAVQPHEP
jgi:hypothetical protein